MAAKLKLKSGDSVKVIAGDDRGQKGEILKVFPEKNLALVEGINMVSKHNKPNAANPQGGITKKEASIHISNLMLLIDGEATRVGYRMEEGEKIRFSKKSNKES